MRNLQKTLSQIKNIMINIEEVKYENQDKVQ